jgi:hypothetical protein
MAAENLEIVAEIKGAHGTRLRKTPGAVNRGRFGLSNTLEYGIKAA